MFQKCLLSKEEFCKYIQKIKELREQEDQLNDAFQRIDPSSGNVFLFSGAEETILSLLQKLMNDEHRDEVLKETELEYYIYETDFGKYFTSVWDSDNTEYDISTPEKFYDYLIKQKF